MLGGNVSILDCDFIGNTTGFEGGALRLAGECLVRGCLFDDNTGGIGGAVHVNQTAVVDFVECTFINNFVDERGGAISNTSPN